MARGGQRFGYLYRGPDDENIGPTVSVDEEYPKAGGRDSDPNLSFLKEGPDGSDAA